MSRFTVTIDRIVLRGFEHADSKAIAEALKSELSHVLSDPRARAQWAHSHRISKIGLGRLPFEPGPSGARKFGNQMACAFGRALKP
jgi:hypothetical protein